MPAFLILFVLVGGLIYGYSDAYMQKKVNAEVRAWVVTGWSVYYDTLDTFGHNENGQLYVQVIWSQPKQDQRVSSIHVRGSVTEGSETVTSFDAPCMRISEERDSRFTKSRTVVSLIPGQHGVVDFRLPG